MEKKIESLIKAWEKRNISGIYCAKKEQAIDKVLEIIPHTYSVGFSGSHTLEQLGIIAKLEARENKVFNPYKPGLSRGESLELRRLGCEADYYLVSANAISQGGELVFLSAYGNRTAGIAYAKNVLVICGINKITVNLQEALKRAREYATPLNVKRLGWNTPCFKDGLCHKDICLFPDYKRMCCQALIIEAEVSPGRLKVILVGENLGF
ncbi:MAG: lactate utilization protein [Candidatus Omnitrophica bacterium]|nr:lactate utilization protein [Candidatus Omnitrophota bacterium]MBU1869259.1 lactate utilization protein [Candidatus Omnitrophota bacterium]